MKKRKIREDLIEKKLTQITDSINVITENFPYSYEKFVQLGLAKEGIYKKLEFAIECIFDICNILNSDLGLGMPEEEETIITNLQKNKILDEKTISIIIEMKKFRNILIHKYGEINDEQAFETIKNGLQDFDIILKEIERVLVKFK